MLVAMLIVIMFHSKMDLFVMLIRETDVWQQDMILLLVVAENIVVMLPNVPIAVLRVTHSI